MARIFDVQFSKATRGWNCEIAFRVQTRRQCTREDHTVRGYGKLGVLGALLAYVNARRAVRREVRLLQALPGPWPIDGSPLRLAAPTPEAKP
jgi:hypothetical protein